METVEDYNELDRLEKREGREVLVLYSRFIYRAVDGNWVLVGRYLDSGEKKYINRADRKPQ